MTPAFIPRLGVQDIASASDHLAQDFGFRPEGDTNRLRLDDQRIELHQDAAAAGHGRIDHLALAVDDDDAALATALARGGCWTGASHRTARCSSRNSGRQAPAMSSSSRSSKKSNLISAFWVDPDIRVQLSACPPAHHIPVLPPGIPRGAHSRRPGGHRPARPRGDAPPDRSLPSRPEGPPAAS